MPNHHYEALMHDTRQEMCMSPQPFLPNGQSSSQQGIQELAIPSWSLRRRSIADTEIQACTLLGELVVPVSEAEHSGLSSALMYTCSEPRLKRTTGHSFSDVEHSPSCSMPADNVLSTTSSIEHENEESGGTGAVQPQYAFILPSNPEEPAAEPNPTWTSRPLQFPVNLLNESANRTFVCRICHDGDKHEALLSMCKCSGSVGLVHGSCLQRWLNVRNDDYCELCHHRFPTRTTAQYSSVVCIFHWFVQCERKTQWAVLAELLIFTAMPLVAALGCYLLVRDASMQAVRSYARLTGLLMMTFIVAYTVGFFLRARNHYLSFRSWQSENLMPKLLVVPPTR